VEESSQKIMELEAMCKRLREDAQKFREEKATLEGMVESHDERIMEITKDTGLDHMGQDPDDEEEGEDADDGRDTTTPPTPKKIIMEEGPVEMVPEQEAPVVNEVILADVEPEMPQPRRYHMLMRDYEDGPPRMMDD
jgi:hypothetical protein